MSLSRLAASKPVPPQLLEHTQALPDSRQPTEPGVPTGGHWEMPSPSPPGEPFLGGLCLTDSLPLACVLEHATGLLSYTRVLTALQPAPSHRRRSLAPGTVKRKQKQTAPTAMASVGGAKATALHTGRRGGATDGRTGSRVPVASPRPAVPTAGQPPHHTHTYYSAAVGPSRQATHDPHHPPRSRYPGSRSQFPAGSPPGHWKHPGSEPAG